jgi:hypothetical protein
MCICCNHEKVQPLLQKAYKDYPDGFYIHAPKQRGNVKEQLGYIGRYIRRPAIALHRIEEYDGQHVTFKYVDKTDGEEKRETISAACGGEMYPEYYKGIHGYEYKISDVRQRILRTESDL